MLINNGVVPGFINHEGEVVEDIEGHHSAIINHRRNTRQRHLSSGQVGPAASHESREAFKKDFKNNGIFIFKFIFGHFQSLKIYGKFYFLIQQALDGKFK